MADQKETENAGPEAVEASGADPVGDGPTPARRPYAPPKLRYLGKVADLTFGATGSVNEHPNPALGQKHK
jgi:hypothetical protein